MVNSRCNKCDKWFTFPAYIKHSIAGLGFSLFSPACPWCAEPLYKEKVKKPEKKQKEAPAK